MKKRICPICDTEMKSTSYCRVCRSFVWHPRIEERNYYLNEGRSAAKPASSQAAAPQTQKKIQPQTTYRRIETQPNRPLVQPTVQRKYENREQNAKNYTKLKSFLIFLFIILAINIVLPLMQRVRDDFHSETVWVEEQPEQEQIWSEGNIQDMEMYELDAQQVRDAGERCTEVYHVDISLDAAKELTERFFAEYGISEYHIEEYSDNTLKIYDDGNEDTYYNTFTDYNYSESSGIGEGRIEIGSDTGSGELHYFEVMSENLDTAIAAILTFVEAVDLSDHNQSMEAEKIQNGILENELVDPEWEDIFWIQGDNWYLYMMKMDDMYYLLLNAEEPFE